MKNEEQSMKHQLSYCCIIGYIFFLAALFVGCSSPNKGQRKTVYSGEEEKIRILFYNVENLFDTINDPATLDNDFLPDGKMRWTHKRYHAKLFNIYKTVTAIMETEDLAVIGLCEIENKGVLEDLINKTPLANGKYSIVHEDSRDRRGIDVALLYREDLFELLSYNYIPVPLKYGSKSRGKNITRDILHATGRVFGDDTLHLFFNHWPSRFGGHVKSIPLRICASQTLVAYIDSMCVEGVDNKLVIMGDFNDDPGDQSMLYLAEESNCIGLYNMMGQKESFRYVSEILGGSSSVSGTLKYRGSWNTFDQVVVSQNLLSEKGGLYVPYAVIGDFDFLLVDDEKYGGKKLFRTYYAQKYIEGFSDHLPVYIDLVKRKEKE